MCEVILQICVMSYLELCEVILQTHMCHHPVGLDVQFVLYLHLLPYFVYMSNKGFEETVYLHGLI